MLKIRSFADGLTSMYDIFTVSRNEKKKHDEINKAANFETTVA